MSRMVAGCYTQRSVTRFDKQKTSNPNSWTLVDSGADANFVSHTWASKCLSKTEGKPKVTQAVEQESAFVEQAIPGSNATISIQVRSQKDGKKRKPMWHGSSKRKGRTY
ncbi:predicted protein [Histoplasma capsulatum G186AR]|uniref:Uncharacterized protein n=1 Tax=Ajellomyces capsulatus (strain G186AR / H82 / ATCC MYA-2454 / RMSCC 2432) TaxID=447093 RepID=C0NFZ9_AJECG|nr:uncharacterized protein HCBG_01815 [Histoplasma capsulatum G186AR]EEH10170.1 predicted protein [Histoplasma capsulatum G186AR]